MGALRRTFFGRGLRGFLTGLARGALCQTVQVSKHTHTTQFAAKQRKLTALTSATAPKPLPMATLLCGLGCCDGVGAPNLDGGAINELISDSPAAGAGAPTRDGGAIIAASELLGPPPCPDGVGTEWFPSWFGFAVAVVCLSAEKGFAGGAPA